MWPAHRDWTQSPAALRRSYFLNLLPFKKDPLVDKVKDLVGINLIRKDHLISPSFLVFTFAGLVYGLCTSAAEPSGQPSRASNFSSVRRNQFQKTSMRIGDACRHIVSLQLGNQIFCVRSKNSCVV